MADSVKKGNSDNQVTFGGQSIIFVREVAKRLCCHYSHVYRLAESGVIPRPINIGVKHFAWLEDDINAHVAARLAQGGAA
jgi:excisionase family DNA binding protein